MRNARLDYPRSPSKLNPVDGVIQFDDGGVEAFKLDARDVNVEVLRLAIVDTLP